MKNYQKFITLFASVIFVLSTAVFFFQGEKSENTLHQTEISTAETRNFTAAKHENSNFDGKNIIESYGKLPLYFEPNLGQTDSRVRFTARGHGYALFLTEREAVLSLQKRGKDKSKDQQTVVRMQIEGANASPKTAGLDETEGKSNYFIGNDRGKWQTEVPNYKRVKYESVYEGVDLVYYGNNQQLEYDFLVQPSADPNQIKLKFDGVKSAKIDKSSGDLLLETEVGTLRQHAPVVYQNIGGERKE